MLVPPSVMNDAVKMKDLEDALEDAANKTLKFPEPESRKIVPEIRFDELLFALLALVPRFEFQLPPYFVNNERALAGLEGMAKSADGTFNMLKEVYPVAIRRVLKNPNQSEVLRKTARTLAYDDSIGGLAFASLLRVLNDAANLTGIPRFKIAFDALQSSEGWRLLAETFKAEISRRARFLDGLLLLARMYKEYESTNNTRERQQSYMVALELRELHTILLLLLLLIEYHHIRLLKGGCSLSSKERKKERKKASALLLKSSLTRSVHHSTPE